MGITAMAIVKIISMTMTNSTSVKPAAELKQFLGGPIVVGLPIAVGRLFAYSSSSYSSQGTTSSSVPGAPSGPNENTSKESSWCSPGTENT